ncbi:hypothetical protein YC2023_103368 [Brassica napus]
MIEVSYIHQNHRKGGRDLDLMNPNFSLPIKKLESVAPRKLSHQEKLAFWINIHNALCHARTWCFSSMFLVNGVPQNNGKRFLLLCKPAYNIGGRMVSVEAVQSYIPRIRMPRPGQGIYQELETAKEEYSSATFGVKKDQKLVLPKIIESLRKDSGLNQAALVEMIQECLPETIIKRNFALRSRKSIVEWTPHSFAFRHLIARELFG